MRWNEWRRRKSRWLYAPRKTYDYLVAHRDGEIRKPDEISSLGLGCEENEDESGSQWIRRKQGKRKVSNSFFFFCASQFLSHNYFRKTERKMRRFHNGAAELAKKRMSLRKIQTKEEEEKEVRGNLNFHHVCLYFYFLLPQSASSPIPSFSSSPSYPRSLHSNYRRLFSVASFFIRNWKARGNFYATVRRLMRKWVRKEQKLCWG